jgi:hypothetical protein
MAQKGSSFPAPRSSATLESDTRPTLKLGVIQRHAVGATSPAANHVRSVSENLLEGALGTEQAPRNLKTPWPRL